MVPIALLVDQALRNAGIPLDGVSIGDPTNRATWRVQFTAAATTAQRTQAATMLATVAVDASAQAAQEQHLAQGQIDALPILLKAIVLTLVDQINVLRQALPTPLPAVTPAQVVAAIRAKAGTL